MKQLFGFLFIVLLAVPLVAQERPSRQGGRRPDPFSTDARKLFEEASPALGSVAPKFVATNLEGDEVKLSDFAGKKYVVLTFGSFT